MCGQVDEVRHLAVGGVPVPADDEPHEALGVPEDGCRPGLGHPHQTLPVHLQDLVIDTNPAIPGTRKEPSSIQSSIHFIYCGLSRSVFNV